MDRWSKKTRVMHGYDVTSRIYDVRYAEEQRAKIEAALKHVHVEEESMVLDVGCGTGIFLEHVGGAAKLTVGLDTSRNMLKCARERVKNLAGVHLVLGDADFMPFTAGIFSHVLAFTLVQNMPEPLRTLREMLRVAEGKATVVVSGLKKIFTAEVFAQLLAQAGLQVVAWNGEGLQCHVAICTRKPQA